MCGVSEPRHQFAVTRSHLYPTQCSRRAGSDCGTGASQEMGEVNLSSSGRFGTLVRWPIRASTMCRIRRWFRPTNAILSARQRFEQNTPCLARLVGCGDRGHVFANPKVGKMAQLRKDEELPDNRNPVYSRQTPCDN